MDYYQAAYLSAMFRKTPIINYFNNNTGSEEATTRPYYTRHLIRGDGQRVDCPSQLIQHTPVGGQLIMQRTTLQTLILQTHGIIRHAKRPARRTEWRIRSAVLLLGVT